MSNRAGLKLATPEVEAKQGLELHLSFDRS